MANYSPQFIAAMRHDYEHTDKSLARIAADHGISERTVNRWRDRYGWARRSERVRDLPPAVLALQEATKLLVGTAVGSPPSCGEPPPYPPPQAGEGKQEWKGGRSGEGVPASPREDGSVATIERIERLVERELEAEEAARKTLGLLPRPAADAERCARTLATLTQTLHALARLRSGQLPDNGLADDDMPRDIDEFRRRFARRIRMFVQGRTGRRAGDGGVAGGDAGGKP